MRGQPVAGGVHRREHHGQHDHDEPRGAGLVFGVVPVLGPVLGPGLGLREPGANVAENIASSQETVIIFDKITPARVSSFYARALPQDGYTITTNSVVSQSGSTAAIIQFTGHGFSGNIDALSKFTDSAVSVAGLGHKNVTTISFMPK